MQLPRAHAAPIRAFNILGTQPGSIESRAAFESTVGDSSGMAAGLEDSI